MTVFRGDTSKCLAHLFSVSFDRDVREILAEFAGISPDTTQRWKTRVIKPAGESLIRVRHFLELCGYEVTEHENLDPVARELGRALAYGVASTEDIAEALDAPMIHRRHRVHEYLIGRRRMMPERREKAKVYNASLEAKVRAAREAWLKKLPIVRKVRAAKPEDMVAAALPVARGLLALSGADAHGEKKFVIEAAAHLVLGLIPLADYLLSESCSEEDRKKLHELAGADSVLKLTTRLRRLCSETARRQLKDI